MHPFPLHISTGIAPAVERAGVLNKVDANLFEDGFCIRLDDFQSFVIEKLEQGNVTLNILGRLDLDRGAFSAAGGAAPAARSASCNNITHGLSPLLAVLGWCTARADPNAGSSRRFTSPLRHASALTPFLREAHCTFCSGILHPSP